MAEILNRLKVDVGTLGNHEFDFGQDPLVKFIYTTNFPFVVSNVVNKNTGKPLNFSEESAYIDYDENFRIGVIGLVEEGWLTALPDFAKSSWGYIDYVQCARELTTKLINVMKCNFIIALTHMRWQNDERLQKLVPDIDLILGGHDHHLEVRTGSAKKFTPSNKHPIIVKSGYDFHSFSIIRVFMSNNGNTDVQIEQRRVHLEGEIDTKTEVRIQELNNRLRRCCAKPLFKLERSLDITKRVIGSEECCFGVYIAEFIKKYTNVDIALIDAGAFYGNYTFSKGHLFTKEDLLNIFPLTDRIIVFECPGHVLLQTLNNSVSKQPHPDPKFLQVSGLRFKGNGLGVLFKL